MTTTTTSKIDFASLTTRASNGERLTVKHLAREFGMKAPDMKRALVANFGTRITFKRGRTGGIHITA